MNLTFILPSKHDIGLKAGNEIPLFKLHPVKHRVLRIPVEYPVIIYHYLLFYCLLSNMKCTQYIGQCEAIVS